jgi:hypothetical protein
MNEVHATSLVEAPSALKALRLRKFQDPLLDAPVKIGPVPIYA